MGHSTELTRSNVSKKTSSHLAINWTRVKLFQVSLSSSIDADYKDTHVNSRLAMHTCNTYLHFMISREHSSRLSSLLHLVRDIVGDNDGLSSVGTFGRAEGHEPGNHANIVQSSRTIRFHLNEENKTKRVGELERQKQRDREKHREQER